MGKYSVETSFSNEPFISFHFYASYIFHFLFFNLIFEYIFIQVWYTVLYGEFVHVVIDHVFVDAVECICVIEMYLWTNCIRVNNVVQNS